MPTTNIDPDVEKIASIMIDTTLLIERITSIQEHIEPLELSQIMEKLSNIGERVGVLYISSDRAYLDKVGSHIDISATDNFLNEAAEYLFQVDRFANMIEGRENATV